MSDPDARDRPASVITLLKALDRRIQSWSPGEYWSTLMQQTRGGEPTLLDVGCGRNPREQRPYLARFSTSVGVDLVPVPNDDEGVPVTGHDAYICLDIRDLAKELEPDSFDYVISMDVIEHLPKEDGWSLLDAMETIARERVIVATPTGFYPQGEYDGNVYQEHLSGWEPWEFRERGYRVFGVNGWKPLRGGRNRHDERPNRYIGRVNGVTRWAVVKRPEHAFQFMAVLDLT